MDVLGISLHADMPHKSGNLETLEWAIEHGCACDMQTRRYASVNNHDEEIKLSIEIGVHKCEFYKL